MVSHIRAKVPKAREATTALAAAIDGRLTSERRKVSRPDTAQYLAFAAALVMLAAMLGVAFEKNLVATLTQHGWGRTLQGIGAALTQRNCGVGGFVIDKDIDHTLRIGGFSDSAQNLNRLGVSYPANLQNPMLLQNALDRTSTMDCPPSDLVRSGADAHYRGLLGFGGEDAGMATFTRLAFALFGTNLPALTYSYFAIALISLLLFAASHHRHRGAMIAAGLLSVVLYLAVCSSLLNFAIPDGTVTRPGIDLKDPRFLGTLAALPLLHIIVTWIRPPFRLALRDYLLLAAQAMILAFVWHIRFPVAWTLLALPTSWLFLVKLRRCARDGESLGQRRSSRSGAILAAMCLIPCIVQAGVSWSYHPFYKVEGDLGRHTFWDGALMSLADNPAWSAKYGAAVNGATGDELPVAVAALAITRLPADKRQANLNANASPTRVFYEKASRTLFLDVLRHDPGFVVQTFLEIKPGLMLRSELTMYRSLFAGLSGWHIVLPLVVLALLCWLAARETVGFLSAVSIAAVLCALIALLPNWLVTVNQLVMFDSFTWSLFFICSLPIVAAAALGRFVPAFGNSFQLRRTEGALASSLDDSVPVLEDH